MKNTNNNTLVSIFFEEMKNFNMLLPSYYLAAAYYDIFKIYALDDKDFEGLLKIYFDYWNGSSSLKETEYYQEQWMFILHKSIRQCDFFNHCKVETPNSLLTPEDTIRRNELLILRKKIAKEQKIDFKNCSSEAYKTFNNQFNIDYKEQLNELYTLNGKMQNVQKESINGYLDSLLWNLINFDSKEILMKTLISTFEEYKLINKL